MPTNREVVKSPLSRLVQLGDLHVATRKRDWGVQVADLVRGFWVITR